MGKRVGGPSARDVQRVERERRWQGHVSAWRQSGSNQAEYCRRHGLAPADFSWWKHALARRGLTAPPAPQFVPVPVITRSSEATGCEVVLRNGRRLRLGQEIDPGWVAKLAAALEASAPC